MKYFIDDVEVLESEFCSRLEEEVEIEVSGYFDDLIDDTEPPVKVLGLIFSPSLIVKRLDPAGYHEFLYNEVVNKKEDYQREFENEYCKKIGTCWFETQEEEEEDDIDN